MLSSHTKIVRVFYCYAPEDRLLLDQLDKHLSPLKRLNEIITWSDCDVQAGKDWVQEIQTQLHEAGIVLVLLSPDFIASDYCYHRQMQIAFDRHNEGKAHIIPILIRPVIWEDTPLGKLQILPANGLPITNWTNLDEGFWDVAKGIRLAIRQLLSPKVENTVDSSQNPNEEIITAKQNPQMAYNMINTQEAVTLFQQLMHSTSQIQVLRFVGAGKMGKSHLLTKVFPVLAHQEYRARSLLYDLRNPVHTVSDILYALSSQLGSHVCTSYFVAYEALFSRSYSSKDIDELHHRDYYLTSCFVKDITMFKDSILLFLFDSVNNATRRVQTWLTDIFLPQIASLDHVRVVLAARSLPNIHTDVGIRARTYQLRPITDEEAFVDFCKTLNLKLGEQSIRDFAYACDYIPGIFADLVLPKFGRSGDH